MGWGSSWVGEWWLRCGGWLNHNEGDAQFGNVLATPIAGSFPRLEDSFRGFEACGSVGSDKDAEEVLAGDLLSFGVGCHDVGVDLFGQLEDGRRSWQVVWPLIRIGPCLRVYTLCYLISTQLLGPSSFAPPGEAKHNWRQNQWPST